MLSRIFSTAWELKQKEGRAMTIGIVIPAVIGFSASSIIWFFITRACIKKVYKDHIEDLKNIGKLIDERSRLHESGQKENEKVRREWLKK